MEKVEKEAKKRFATTVEQGLDLIKADPEARMTLAELKSRGFDEKKIAGSIVMYCGGRPEDAKEGLKLAKNCGKALADSAEKLRISADSVENASKLLDQCRWPIAGIDELPESLRSSAEWLSNIATRIRIDLKNIRLEKSITSGRQHVLLILAYVLSNGERPSGATYLKIGKLVAAVMRTPEPNYNNIADGLRKTVERLASTDVGKQLIEAAEAKEIDLT